MRAYIVTRIESLKIANPSLAKPPSPQRFPLRIFLSDHPRRLAAASTKAVCFARALAVGLSRADVARVSTARATDHDPTALVQRDKCWLFHERSVWAEGRLDYRPLRIKAAAL